MDIDILYPVKFLYSEETDIVMKIKTRKVLGFSAVIFPEEGVYSCHCPELGVASWGHTVEEAVKNLREAVQLHLECLPPSELRDVKKLTGNKLLTTIQVSVPA